MNTTLPPRSAFLALALSLTAQASPFIPVQDLNEVPPGMAYDVKQPPVESTTQFRGKRVAIIASQGVQDIELTFPYEYLVNRGAEVEILAPSWVGSKVLLVDFVKPTQWAPVTRDFKAGMEQNYDMILVVGGAWATQVVRKDADAIALIRSQHASGKPVAIICSGAQVLVDSGLAKGRRVTGTPSVKTDLENAGGTYVDQEVVVEDGLIMSRSPGDLPAFVKAIGEAL